MKAGTLREQTEEELRQLHRETKQHIHDLRAKRGLGEGSEQPLKTRTLRRELARIMTIMRERGIRNNG